MRAAHKVLIARQRWAHLALFQLQGKMSEAEEGPADCREEKNIQGRLCRNIDLM